MIKLKRGEKLYKILKSFFWSPLYTGKKGSGYVKPGSYLGLNPLGAEARIEIGQVELVEDDALLCEHYEKHNPEGAKRHAAKAAAKKAMYAKPKKAKK